jgi:hypothetical protein
MDTWFEDWFLNQDPINFIFIGIYPPSESSIARYNAKVFSSSSVLFLPTNLSNENVLRLNVKNGTKFLPVNSSNLLRKFTDKPLLASIGNSPDHINTIYRIFEDKIFQNHQDSILQIHDVSILWLLELSFGHDYVKARINEIYAHDDFYGRLPSEFSHREKLEHGIMGISILLELVGKPSQIIVHNAKAQELVKRDLASIGFDCLIKVIQLPFLDEELQSEPKVLGSLTANIKGSLRIGTFGAVDSHKNIIETYHLIKCLRKSNKNITWVVAGRSSKQFFKSKKINEPWIELYDQLSSSEFIDLMSSLDAQLLLRLHSNGESSGVAIQTQKLNIPLVVTPDIVNGFDAKSTFFVTASDFQKENPTDEIVDNLNVFLESIAGHSHSEFKLPFPEDVYLAISKKED